MTLFFFFFFSILKHDRISRTLCKDVLSKNDIIIIMILIVLLYTFTPSIRAYTKKNNWKKLICLYVCVFSLKGHQLLPRTGSCRCHHAWADGAHNAAAHFSPGTRSRGEVPHQVSCLGKTDWEERRCRRFSGVITGYRRWVVDSNRGGEGGGLIHTARLRLITLIF